MNSFSFFDKQLEQKSKKVRSLEESLQQMESQIFELDSERKQLDDQVQHWKNEAVENKEKIREEVCSLSLILKV